MNEQFLAIIKGPIKSVEEKKAFCASRTIAALCSGALGMLGELSELDGGDISNLPTLAQVNQEMQESIYQRNQEELAAESSQKNEITAETTEMTKAEGFHDAIEEFVVVAFRAMKSAQDSAEAKLLDWNQSLDLSRGGIDKLAEGTRSESVFAKLMEQVELNQPVVFEVNEALAGLPAKQVAIEVEDEEEKIEGEKKKKTEAQKMLPPSMLSITPTLKPKKDLQVIDHQIKSEDKKPEVKAMPRKAEKETRYADDEKERKKARYESKPTRPEDGETVPKEPLSVPVSWRPGMSWARTQEFVF